MNGSCWISADAWISRLQLALRRHGRDLLIASLLAVAGGVATYSGARRLDPVISDLFNVWFSSDTGVTWSRRDQGLATDRVCDVSFSPYCPLVCATNGAGVYISEDTGQSWQSVGPYSTAVTVAAGWHEVWATVVAAVHGGDSSGIWAADVAGWAWHRELGWS